MDRVPSPVSWSHCTGYFLAMCPSGARTPGPVDYGRVGVKCLPLPGQTDEGHGGHRADR